MALGGWLCAFGLAWGGPSGCARGGSACPPGTKGAKCRWEHQRRATIGDTRAGAEADFAGGKEPLGRGGVWGSVEQVLLRGQDALTQGYVGEEIMNALVDMCEISPLVQRRPTGLAWTCPLAESITMYGGSFALEVGEQGVVSLTALNLTKSSAERFLFVSTNRWKQPRWCIEAISRPEPALDDRGRDPSPSRDPADADAAAGDGSAPRTIPENPEASAPASREDDTPLDRPARGSRSWRCALPDRLALVAAQFPQAGGEDSEDLWQVSLAVVGAR